jgi:prevent-host-death family protein
MPLVYIMYAEVMNEPLRMGVRDFRNDVPKRVEAAHFQGEPTIITKNDEPRAVLVPYAWYEQQVKGTG